MWPFRKFMQRSSRLTSTEVLQTPLHFVVGCLGTTGDILPLITIAAQLRERGHQVTLIAPPTCESAADRYELSFVPLSAWDDYQRSTADFFLCSTRYAPLFLVRHAIKWNRVFYETARSLTAPGTVILTPHLGMIWADYAMHAEFGTPAIRILYDPPPTAGVRSEAPILPLGRVQEDLSSRFDREWGAAVGGTRGRRRHRLWQRMRRATSWMPKIGLYPDWLVNDKRTSMIPTFGFVSPLSLDGEVYRLPFEITPAERLVVFLAGTIGNTASWSQEFFSVSVQICNHLGCRGMLLGPESPKPAVTLNEQIAWEKFAPLNQILPYASVIVHHGGIGTAAAAIASGVPQLILPRFGPQPRTADRLRRLGVAMVLRPQAYTVQQATTSVRALLENGSAYRSRSLSLALRPNSFDAAARVCDYLERRFGAELEGCDRPVAVAAIGAHR